MVSPRQLRRARGFTLTELLVGVMVMGVLAAIAAPSFSSLAGNMRGRGASSDLYAALVRSRSEAIKLNQPVQLVSSGGANNWQAGWTIPDPTGLSTNLDVHSAVSAATITGPASVTFLPNGRVKDGGTPQFDVSVTGNPQHRCVEVDLGGRASQTNSGC